ncbi:MAG: UPF0182 family protein, partial [Polyangiales bacterium]
AAVLWAMPALATLYIDAAWFDALGYPAVFRTRLHTQIALGVCAGLAAGGLCWGQGRLALQLCRLRPGLKLRDAQGRVQLHPERIVARLLLPFSLLLALLVGLQAADQWQAWLTFRHAVAFRIQDPLYGRDLAFYVLKLPWITALHRSLSFVLVAAALISAALHYIAGGITLNFGRWYVAEQSKRHLLLQLTALLLLLAAGAWLRSCELLYSNAGPVHGPGYADVHARLPALRLLIAVAVAAALIAAVTAFLETRRLLWGALAAYLAVEVLGVRVYPTVIQRFVVLPNEAVREKPFIAHNIAATRHAWGLGRVVERELQGSTALTASDIRRNRSTVENIRLWDHQPLLDTFAQIQEIRTYYEFPAVDNDRYRIDGALRQTMLSARELSTESLPNRTWINEHFTFTHGYGITLGPVNQSTEEGLPELFIRDIPPRSTTPTLQVKRPQIYFGERVNDYVFVRTAAKEFDHPAGENNVFSRYRGRGGVPLHSKLTRTALALHLRSLKVLLSEDLRPESRVLLRRHVRRRVRHIAPFLTWDADPYLVLRPNGKLAWILDAYTVSRRYPYAQPAEEGTAQNYMRNAVKAVIDAYDGRVTLYVAHQEPIIRSWQRAFPTLFRPLQAMPQDLRAHLRYPEDLFRTQAQVFSVYHMRKAELVYNREDQWQVPAVKRQQNLERMQPYYTVMRLPEEDRPEFILMLPFSPKRKDNLAAWMVARMDGDKLGELVVYRFPKDRLVFGPSQIMNRIQQDAEISRQISLWDQRGSEALLGTLLVIPIERSLIYVCPLYLRSSGGHIPELKRVIVAHENDISMAPTLDGALQELFGADATTTSNPISSAAEPALAQTAQADTAQSQDGGPPVAAPEMAATGPTTAPQTVESRAWQAQARRAEQTLAAANRAVRDGDWARYGTLMQQLEKQLKTLVQSREAKNSAPAP